MTDPLDMFISGVWGFVIAAYLLEEISPWAVVLVGVSMLMFLHQYLSESGPEVQV